MSTLAACSTHFMQSYVSLTKIFRVRKVPQFSSQHGIYHAGSKAALIHTMKQCSACLVPSDIRVKVIAAGVYPSDMSENFLFLCSRGGAYWIRNIIITMGNDYQSCKEPTEVGSE